ncbi:hypothetical protein L873DRAFT_1803332 [Choiromyces venosus 120613-1]|uniref:Uncharacterized protein n=1 Tax=Choiromyces venosus 120613-1 TaxID=1336337 RepID=A0A3N4JTA6_9PEZI|nr:hypothetical protein L873DRAFT_1803230 [Choiromyces venosus 120613-1]RPB01586.1 hypothetical protein L873DRAFT_1803332 [Choiromyces venosus 120613-1]
MPMRPALLRNVLHPGICLKCPIDTDGGSDRHKTICRFRRPHLYNNRPSPTTLCFLSDQRFFILKYQLPTRFLPHGCAQSLLLAHIHRLRCFQYS